MSKLAAAADVLSGFVHLGLPVVLALHAGVLVAYGALSRDWKTLGSLLPRNLTIMAVVGGLYLLSGPIHQRALHWRWAESYVAAEQVSSELAAGHYLAGLKARQLMTMSSPARDALDREIEAMAPRVLTQSITLANRGDYGAAIALASALPDTGSQAHKRAKVLALWAPYALRQQQQEAASRAAATVGFRRQVAPALAQYDALAQEIVPRASNLDPTATIRVNGRSVHPMAAMLMAAGVRARSLEGTVEQLPAGSPTLAAVRLELKLAAAALKRGCVESLSYANTADEGPEERAKAAFAEAKRRRERAEALLQGRTLPAATDAASPTPDDYGNAEEDASPSPSPRGSAVPGARPSENDDPLEPKPEESGSGA